jgi:alpha-tubulin suppressor-like RCC1 family protein
MDCGLNHSAAVTRDGRLFVWGKWHSKEVAKTRAGVAVYHDQLEPRLVEVGGSHSPVVDVVCSLSQTLIQTADGKVCTAVAAFEF